MKYRKLRIAWSVFWCLAGVLLIVLWVRSYRGERHIPIVGHWIVSYYGNIFVDIYFPGEAVGSENLGPGFRLAYWVPVLIVGFSGLIAVPWTAFTKQFSLRTLMIATTLMALVLGMIVYMLRTKPALQPPSAPTIRPGQNKERLFSAPPTRPENNFLATH